MRVVRRRSNKGDVCRPRVCAALASPGGRGAAVEAQNSTVLPFEFDGAVQQLRTGALYMKQVAVVLGCRPSERAWPPDDGGNLGL